MKKIILLAMLLAVIVVPNVVNAYDATGYTCTNLELNPSSISRTSWWVDMSIDAARLDSKPYNDSIRIVNQPCGQAAGGDAVARDVYNITQDANQIMTNFSVAFVTNGTFASRFNYSILYATTPKGNVTYTENLTVTGAAASWIARWTTSNSGNVYLGIRGGLPANASAPSRNFTQTATVNNGIRVGGVTKYGEETGTTYANCGLVYDGTVKKILQCNSTSIAVKGNLTFYARVPFVYITFDTGWGALGGILHNGYGGNTDNKAQYRNQVLGYTVSQGETGVSHITTGIVSGYVGSDTYGWGYLWKNGTLRAVSESVNFYDDANTDARPMLTIPSDAFAGCTTGCGNFTAVQYLASGIVTNADLENDYQRNINPITVTIIATPSIPDTTNSLLIYQYANMSNIDNHSIVWKLNIVVFNNDTVTLTNIKVDGANNFSIANYTIASLAAGVSNLSQFAYNLTRENITTSGIDRVINLEPAKFVGNATGSSNALTIVNPVDPPSKLGGGIASCWTADKVAKTIWVPIGCMFEVALGTIFGTS